MSAEKLEKIAVLNDPAEAEVLRGLLEAQGMSVLMTKEAASTAIGLTFGAFSEIELFVPANKAAQAKRLASEFFGDSLLSA
jgi:hypothetical protein